MKVRIKDRAPSQDFMHGISKNTKKETKTMKEITTQRAIELLCCTKKTLQRLKTSGEAKSVKRGRQWFFNEDEILSLQAKVKGRTKHAPKKKPEPKPIKELLKKDGLEVIATLTDELKAMGIYKELDRNLIFAAALAYQTAVEYEIKAIELDYTALQANGSEKEHHYADVAKKHFERYINVCEKLGLTPIQRIKIKQENKEEIDPMAALIA